MTAPENDVWDHWAENRCDSCDRDIPAAAGALCSKCALDFQLPDDPFVMDGPVETFDDVFNCRARETSLNRARRLRREAQRRGGAA